MTEIIQGCVDRPDERDFLAGNFSEVFGSEFDLKTVPENLDLRTNRFKANDQGRGTVTCCSNSPANGAEIINELEHHNKDIAGDFMHLWNWMVKEGLTARYGSSIQAGLKALQAVGLRDKNTGEIYKIKYYFKIPTTPEAWVEYLSKGFTIYTGSDWGGTKEGYWIQGAYGHATCKAGYKNLTLNEDGTIKDVDFIGINSQGENWGQFKDGSFLVRKDDVRKFYSSYVFVDEVKSKGLTKREIMRINRMKLAYKMFYLESDEDEGTKHDCEIGKEAAHNIAEIIRGNK